MPGRTPALGGPGPTVFVSHASEDVEVARKVTAALTSAGVDVWLAAERLTVGENYAEEIYQQLRRSAAVLVLLSPSSLESQHVRREVNSCIDLRRLLLPVSLEPGLVSSPALPLDWRYWLGVVQVIPLETIDRLRDVVVKKLDALRPATRPQATSAKRRDSAGGDTEFRKQIRSSLIQIGVEARPFEFALQRCRHLHVPRTLIEQTARDLREAGLLLFDEPLTGATTIRVSS